MYRCHESRARLNRYATVLDGSGVSFDVNNWGVFPCHKDNPVHQHSRFEICYVLSGEGTYMDNGHEYALRKGTLFCSRPKITHQIRSSKGLFLLWVEFGVDEVKSSSKYIDQFRSVAQDASVIVQSGDASPSASLWRSLLIPEQSNWSIAADVISEVAHALLISFLDLFTNQRQEPVQLSSLEINPILQRATSFIEDNLEKKLSLPMLSTYLNVSPRHLSRLLVSGTNKNFTTFVRQERVKKAALLLRTTRLPIKEIAETTGFGGIHYFTRVFTAEKNMPPGRYRNNFR